MKRSTQGMGLGLFVAVVLIGTTFLAQEPVVQQCAADSLKPDLIIQKIYLVKYTNGCYVAVKVKNLGPGPVPDFVWTDQDPKSAGVYLYRNGTGWGGRSIRGFDPCKVLQQPGGTATYVSKLKVSGAVTVRAVVDLWNTFKETNKLNNSHTQTFQEGAYDSTPYGSDLPK